MSLFGVMWLQSACLFPAQGKYSGIWLLTSSIYGPGSLSWGTDWFVLFKGNQIGMLIKGSLYLILRVEMCSIILSLAIHTSSARHIIQKARYSTCAQKMLLVLVI